MRKMSLNVLNLSEYLSSDWTMSIRISKLNLCLGLKYKKDLVKDLLLTNEINILCMQETDIEKFYEELLRIPGLCLETKKNLIKKRTGLL